MSKNVKILQNGNEKRLNRVEKIQTYLSNGKICDWVPEDERRLGILSVSRDGVYNPSEDSNGPYYGYSEVRVNGVGTTEFGSLGEITITKNGEYIANSDSDGPFYGYSKVTVNVKTTDEGGGSSSHYVPGTDDDGDDAVASVDDDGNIVVEKLPTRIAISVYPNNLVYEDGQLIDLTGLKVKAFLPDDTAWGFVPDNEIVIDPKMAIGEEDNGYSHAESELIDYRISMGYTAMPDFQTAQITRLNAGIHVNSGEMAGFVQNGNVMFIYFASKEPDNIAEYTVDRNYGYIEVTDSGTQYVFNKDGEISYSSALNNQYTYDDKTVYWYEAMLIGQNVEYPGVTTVNSWPVDIRPKVAWTMVYGNIAPSSSQQTIAITWKRHGDAKVLETSFSIAVHAPNDENNASGSTMPGSGSNVDVPQ